MRLIGAALLGLIFLGLCGCAFAVRPDGTGVVGFDIGGAGGSPADIGNAVGGILGAIGVPGGTLIGAGVTGVLALLGIGKAKQAERKNAEAERAAADKAWDEAEARMYARAYPSHALAGPLPAAVPSPAGVSEVTG